MRLTTVLQDTGGSVIRTWREKPDKGPGLGTRDSGLGRRSAFFRSRAPIPDSRNPFYRMPEAFLDIRVIPRARKSEVAGLRGDAWLVRLQAPPVEGAANDELIAVLAKVLHVPRRDVTIVSGHRSRDKRVLVASLDSP